jgi:hypothetical protein
MRCRRLIGRLRSAAALALAALLGPGGCAWDIDDTPDASVDGGGSTDTDTDADADAGPDAGSGPDGVCIGGACVEEEDGSWSCDDGGCFMFCDGVVCTCDGGGCDLHCSSAATCTCGGAGGCVFSCTGGARCECEPAASCSADCLGEGTYCCGMGDVSHDEEAITEADCSPGDGGV